VLGVKTRQLNGNVTYPSTSVTDNQLRALNHLGLLNPAFDEASLSGYAKMVSVTNTSADITNRFRSYIDANCAQCHRPGAGIEANFDARYDTPLAIQSIVGGSVHVNLGFDNASVVTGKDLLRSILYDRANTTDTNIQMPPLARNLIDTNGMAAVVAFINSLPGTQALLPPVISPAAGSFNRAATVLLTPPDGSATVRYTLDGSLPTTNSALYTGPFAITNPVVNLSANAFEAGFVNSVATNSQYFIYQDSFLAGSISNGVFSVPLTGAPGVTYILLGSTNLVDWVPIATNTPGVSPFTLSDPNAGSFPRRFYRAVQSP